MRSTVVLNACSRRKVRAPSVAMHKPWTLQRESLCSSHAGAISSLAMCDCPKAAPQAACACALHSLSRSPVMVATASFTRDRLSGDGASRRDRALRPPPLRAGSGTPPVEKWDPPVRWDRGERGRSHVTGRHYVSRHTGCRKARSRKIAIMSQECREMSQECQMSWRVAQDR